MESMVPVCDKRYHIYNRFRHFWAEIKKLWNYPLKGNDLSLVLYLVKLMHFSLFEYNFVYLSLAHRTKRYLKLVSKYSYTTFSLEGDFLRAWLNSSQHGKPFLLKGFFF